ncbi:imelysin family protein [Cypionkella sp.]|uniref:imelysin family protein n=1 Tax=Cypionkella sp. TaxID=2811411 RepID=UPI0027210E30|nr:imelysin family protein [Cypionkella sp.]MDO8985157.1 imelysin family protein [Cypionkella sp.]MDP2047286.1 imelysin family protein [Cypionkella sp.]
MRNSFLALLATTAFVSAVQPVFAADPAAVAKTYADIAAAGYDDSLITAKALQGAVDALTAAPSEDNLKAARAAWIASRPSYMQTEAFRFGNVAVDDWEGKINAWPLDEGLIDYVDPSYGKSQENDLATLNVIATPKFTISGVEVDATTLTPELISGTLQEAGGIEANVASGYHAIEFLLWGQDLNGTGPGAGNRPFTDYVQGEGCTGGNCDRRAAYLKAATDLLVMDLADMAGQWAAGGAARAVIEKDPKAALSAILTGMGSLSYGEVAGQRMRLGLMLNDPEEEHDCFSDNTANSHYYDGVGIQNVYLGKYTRVDGSVVSGASISELVAAADPAVDTQLKGELAATVTALGAIKAASDGGMAYDQMLAAGNKEGEALVMGGVNTLVTQTASIERAITTLGLTGTSIEGSESLDNPGAVFQ